MTPSSGERVPPKIFLPLLDNGNGQVMASFMMDHATAFGGREVFMMRAGDSHADRGMNHIANAFLKSDCDVWVNIDADIRFRVCDVDRLLGHAKNGVSLVYGIYPKKDDFLNPCLCTFNTAPEPDPETGLAELRRAGRGFMLVHRRLLEAMKEDNGGPALRYHNHSNDGKPAVEWAFFKSGVVEGEFSAMSGIDDDGYPIREWISEDWYFCERARKLGFKTMVDTWIALGHVGQKEYRFGADQLNRVDGWHGIHGWFTDADAEVYREIAKSIPVTGSIAEIGTWMGRSLGAFLTFCQELGKTPLIHAIDTFKGTLSEGDAHSGIVASHGGSIRSVFEHNMKPFGLNGRLVIHQSESSAAANEIPDGSMDAIFIDGDHTFEAVSQDIEAWLPKLKPEGIIAGHDYDYPQVAAAVHMVPRLREKVRQIGRCWMVKIT